MHTGLAQGRAGRPLRPSALVGPDPAAGGPVGRSCGASEAISGPAGLHVRLVCPMGASRAPATPRGPRRAQGVRPAGSTLVRWCCPYPFKVERPARTARAAPTRRRAGRARWRPPAAPRRASCGARRARGRACCRSSACSTAAHGAAGLPTHCQPQRAPPAHATRPPRRCLSSGCATRFGSTSAASTSGASRASPATSLSLLPGLRRTAPSHAAAERVRVDDVPAERHRRARGGLPGTLDGLGHHVPHRERLGGAQVPPRVLRRVR